MRFAKALVSSAVVVAAFSGTQARAAAPTLSDVFGASGITVSGAMDASYDWSANDSVAPALISGFTGVPGRVFDTENDGFVLHQVNLSVSKAFAGGIGATANVILGDDANVVSGDLCNFGGESGFGNCDDFDLTQAFVSYANGNLGVIGGRFVTLAGMEVINPSGNINASRSFLFAAQPLVHEGVRASYKVNDLLSLSLGLNNAQFANTRRVGPIFGPTHDNNTDQTLEAQVAVTPMKNLSIYLTGYSGNEDPGVPGNGDANLRSDTVDLVVNFNLTDAIYLGLNADYFNTEDGSGGHVETKGVAGYAQFKFMPKWRVAARSEYVETEAGPGNGIAAVRENTLTLAHACSDNLEILAEGRHDRAVGSSAFDGNRIFDVIDNGPDNDQYTATLKAILKF